jgi:hypothetical protein
VEVLPAPGEVEDEAEEVHRDGEIHQGRDELPVLVNNHNTGSETETDVFILKYFRDKLGQIMGVFDSKHN